MATSTVGKSRNHKKMEEYHHGNRENKKEYYEKNKDKKSNIDGITVKAFLKQKRKKKQSRAKPLLKYLWRTKRKEMVKWTKIQ